LILLIPYHKYLVTTIYRTKEDHGGWENSPLELNQEESERKGGDPLFFLLLLLLLFFPPLLLPPTPKSDPLLAVGKDNLGHGRE
jgi:hypothetical protein